MLKIFLALMALTFIGAEVFAGGFADIQCAKGEEKIDCLIAGLNQFKALGCEMSGKAKTPDDCAVTGSASTIAFANCSWAIEYNSQDKGTEAYNKRAEEACKTKGKNWSYIQNRAKAAKFPGICLQARSIGSAQVKQKSSIK